MRKIFADTGYWIALLNPDDDLHQKAKEIANRINNIDLVTSEMVFTELLNAFSAKGVFYKQKVVKFINYCFDNPEIEVVIQTDNLFKRGLELYSQRLDQAWSMTDCTSFCIMSEKNILEALAYDKHFEQAGFISLLR
ncbi:type II toxin-antitoxin system VapC family toxin [Anabaenopsis elenkinii]|uniref:Type II toxin-antitoxin system VapC family toxin n=1 Tax=Anabaenopsis elenkinii CCIBt3563 TaxID=2779889 RepID=A0A7S6U695_9CYAN|nr:PIN domain-containing protein [Anabaenopsis elenkinii]QOV22663.1 type II toxin-antitoxin system VapC family toxin [Anabaenopsis elenkinii CCIBt3563]